MIHILNHIEFHHKPLIKFSSRLNAFRNLSFGSRDSTIIKQKSPFLKHKTVNDQIEVPKTQHIIK